MAVPKAIPAHSITPVHAYEATANIVSDKRYRVLCVDDSVTIQLLMKKIFSQDPLCEKVDIAVNGKDAREKLNQAKYNVITLDIHMPEVNGIEFLEKLYNRKTDPPVIMVSSVNRTDLDLATKSLSLGAFDYVEKPAMNNLQKSADEILTKARMAMRSSHVEVVSTNTSFDVSIGQKIVIPDASQTLRIAMAAPENIKSLEFIVKGQRGEYRSPALIVVWRDPSNAVNLESELLKWSDRQIVSLRTSNQLLKPNHVYILKSEVVSEVLAKVKAKTASLQILDVNAPDFRMLNSIPSMQVLIDENIAPHRLQIEKQCGVRVSDVTPATSFPSLSVEFFANLRKAVA
jgi:chemotaxis protein methyltransferase CheR